MVTIYTPEQVAGILQIDETEVIILIKSGKLKAFPVLNSVRVTDKALEDFIETAQSLSLAHDQTFRMLGIGGESASLDMQTRQQPATIGTRSRFTLDGQRRPRNRNPEAEDAARKWVSNQIKRVASDLFPDLPRKGFTANGRQGILCVSTAESARGDSWWLGFPERLLSTGRATFIVAVLAFEEGREFKAFVIPYERHKAAIDSLSADRAENKKFNIERKQGSYYLTGKSISEAISLRAYLNAFDLFR